MYSFVWLEQTNNYPIIVKGTHIIKSTQPEEKGTIRRTGISIITNLNPT